MVIPPPARPPTSVTISIRASRFRQEVIRGRVPVTPRPRSTRPAPRLVAAAQARQRRSLPPTARSAKIGSASPTRRSEKGRPVDIPHVTPLRQTAPQPSVTDVAGEVRRRWLASSLPKRIKPGMRVAVGCGSRGIANLDVMVRTTLDVLREFKAEPFIVAAMGSHGGATPEGQRELLAEY